MLRDGRRASGIFPEGVRGDGELDRFHGGAAYLALVTGAPVVPVAVSAPGSPARHTDSCHRRGTRLDVVYGEPLLVERRPWPRPQAEVRRASEMLRNRFRMHLVEAMALTGPRRCPGRSPKAMRLPPTPT